MYGQPIYHNPYAVEVVLPSNAIGTTIQLTDNPILRQPNVLITGVEVFTATQLAKTPQAHDNITDAGMTGLVISLQDTKNEWRVFELPIAALNPETNNGVSRDFEPFRVVMQNSTIKIVDDANLTANQSVYLVFNYVIDEKLTKLIYGN